jgi:hypothetical protein
MMRYPPKEISMSRASFLVVLAATAVLAVGCNDHPTAAPASTSSPSPSAAAPSVSPTPSATALSTTDRAACEAAKPYFEEIFIQRALYSGFAKGIYKGGGPTKFRGILADLKKAMTSYDAWMKKVEPTIESSALQESFRSDIATLAKEAAAIKAGGTDYTGKVVDAVDHMQSENPEDLHIQVACRAS